MKVNLGAKYTNIYSARNDMLCDFATIILLPFVEIKIKNLFEH